MEYCFAWQKNHLNRFICKAITEKCNGRNEMCPFYKTDEQQRESVEAAYKRIAKLPEWQQNAIADAYYGGDKPWKTPLQQPDSRIYDMITDVIGVV